MGAFVYMLRCADGSYYVGSATGDDLWKHVAEHETGAYRGYTFTRRPVRLVWSEHFERITDAIAAERQIKEWSRAKKEALIKGDWDEIKLLAKRRADKQGRNSNVARHPEVLGAERRASKGDGPDAAAVHPSRAASRPPQDDG